MLFIAGVIGLRPVWPHIPHHIFVRIRAALSVIGLVLPPIRHILRVVAIILAVLAGGGLGELGGGGLGVLAGGGLGVLGGVG